MGAAETKEAAQAGEVSVVLEAAKAREAAEALEAKEALKAREATKVKGAVEARKATKALEAQLRNTKLFRGMEPGDLASLLKCLDAQERSFKKGETILLEGKSTNRIGVVLAGSVLIEMNDAWGTTSVLNNIGAGGVFAEAYACIPGEPLMVSVRAAEDARVLILNVRRIMAPCSNTCVFHMQLIQNLLTLCAMRNLQLSQRMMHTAPKSIRKRLMSFFSECMKRAGSYSFSIPYNRQQLADYLNVERSALCNELSHMQRDGLIRYSKNTFTINKDVVGHL